MMKASEQFFTTEQVVELLGLKPKDKWRIIKFAESKEYGIEPALVMGKGLGSRRLYNLENVCQIAVALALLEAGLRPAVIGEALARLGHKIIGRFENRKTPGFLFVALALEQQFGSLLSKKRFLHVDLTEQGYPPESISDEYGENYAVLFVPVQEMFDRIHKGLETMKGKSK